MPDDLEVIMDEGTHERAKSRLGGVGDALVYNFFDRDPFTRRHRSRSVGGIMDVMPHHEPSVAVNGLGGGVATNGNGNIGSSTHAHGTGVVRLMSAEM